MHLGLARLAGEFLVVFSLDGRVGHLRANHFAEESRGQSPVLRHPHRALHVRILVESGLLRFHQQRLLVHELVEQHRVKLLRRHGARLGRQGFGRGLQVADMDRLTIDLGHHRIGVRLRQGRAGGQDAASGYDAEDGDRGEKAGRRPK